MPGASEALKNESYISLETFKKDGGGVKTPVWFVDIDGIFYVFTDGSSFKVKRLSRNPKARIAACNARGAVHGDWFEATGEIVSQPDVEQKAYAALQKKYGFMMSLITLGAKISGSFKRRKILALRAV